MTVLAAFIDGGKAYVMGDRLLTTTGTVNRYAAQKVFQVTPHVIAGFAGEVGDSIGMLNQLRSELPSKREPTREEIYEALDGTQDSDCSTLIVTRSCIYDVALMSIGTCSQRWAFGGMGEHYASGWLAATTRGAVPTLAQIVEAMEACFAVPSLGCGGGIDTVSLPAPRDRKR